MILAIDSSLGSSVAVVDPATGDVLGRADSETTRGHAEIIGDLIVRALHDAGADPADITHIAAGMGPGPFTGLRIGIAAARAFATGRGVPVIPVVSHDAAALERLEAEPERPCLIVTDARRREHAVSAYDGLDDGIPHRVAGPELLPQDADPWSILAEDLTIGRSSDESAGSVRRPATEQTLAISAGAIGRLAARQLAAGRIRDLVEPLYLRAPDAKVPGAVKRVST
ncbi:MAG TPA: tRNA (adenosine(37)-N6)-threonylcarbamoyltransferase complex dimerization subunit type 1 TsaB [Microbacterium sp.]|nr:tRNA (adenosine(37)-N6)-threonylcarbamoyltransferase complex dimerization subunit type 1 TsaB [Microbacterium sp.]